MNAHPTPTDTTDTTTPTATTTDAPPVTAAAAAAPAEPATSPTPAPTGSTLEPPTDELQLRRNASLELTDLGTARRLVDYHGRDLRHCTNLGGWQVWDATRWVRDETGEAMRRTKNIADTMLYKEAEVRHGSEREAHRKWAHRSQSHARLNATLSVAESEPEVAVTHNAFDRDVELFNLANGTIELATGTFRAHRREDLLTKVSPVAYDPNATCPTWDRFLERVLGGDQQLHDYLQKLVGYSLSGRVTQHILPVLYGNGRNGKSTFIRTIERLFGDYATSANDDLLVANSRSQHPTGQADLRGARLVTATETPQDANLNTALVKKLTGGDTVKARLMRQDFFEFLPAFTVFLATNHMPRIPDGDEGIWSRVKKVPFTVFIPAEERDPNLPDKLRAELPGILNWALAGHALYLDEGLDEPDVVTRATDEYRAQSDPMGRFLDQECVLAPDGKAWSADLYDAYTAWCHDEDEEVESWKMFGNRLRKLGLKKKARQKRGDSRVARWYGISLASDVTADQRAA